MRQPSYVCRRQAATQVLPLYIVQCPPQCGCVVTVSGTCAVGRRQAPMVFRQSVPCILYAPHIGSMVGVRLPRSGALRRSAPTITFLPFMLARRYMPSGRRQTPTGRRSRTYRLPSRPAPRFSWVVSKDTRHSLARRVTWLKSS